MIYAIVTGSVLLYAVFGAYIAGVSSRYEAVRNDNGDMPPPEVIGLFWPISVPIIVTVLCIYFLYRKPLSTIYRLGKGEYAKPRLSKPKIVVVGKNARIESSKQYRQLAELVRDYERALPVPERNGG